MAPGLQNLEIIPFRVAAYDTKVFASLIKLHNMLLKNLQFNQNEKSGLKKSIFQVIRYIIKV